MTELTFEQAIAASENLLSQTDLSPTALESALVELLQTSNGARGFWVTFLTGAWADHPHPALINALKTVPEPSAELMVKNVAMSSAMAITHQRNGDIDSALGAQAVTRRSLQILQLWQSDTARAIAQAMYDSAVGKGGVYADFLAKWGYDSEQKAEIAEKLAILLS
jgi:hypothetical protein